MPRIALHLHRDRGKYVHCWGGRKVRKTTLRRCGLGLGLLILVILLTARAIGRGQSWTEVLAEVGIALVALLTPTL